jgi:DNA invertase Pin-like site-specific DNA recombinase
LVVRAYLRASTSQQEASRARGALDAFATEQGLWIAARYVENESGAKLHRSERRVGSPNLVEPRCTADDLPAERSPP